jgi:hypothetical protein
MPKGFIVITGSGVKDTREWAPSATEAFRLIREYMKLRRPGVRVEDERVNPVNFFQLKEIASQEARKSTPAG